MTCGPASMAKSISVAVAESDTMCAGFWLSVTEPTVTGYDGPALGVGFVVPDLPHPVSVRATANATATAVLVMRLIGPPVGRGMTLRRQGLGGLGPRGT